MVGASGRIRTCDTWYRKPVLYPLSYGGMLPARDDRAAERAHPTTRRGGRRIGRDDTLHVEVRRGSGPAVDIDAGRAVTRR